MIPSGNIIEVFLSAACKSGQLTALIQDDQSILFSELEREVKKTAAFYRKKGIGKGDRVLVFVPMSIRLYRTVLALFYIGAIPVFLDEWVGRKRMEACCDLILPKAFIAGRFLLIASLLSQSLRKIPVKIRPGSMEADALQQAVLASDEETALITFTTGSTGIPKAANRTHGFLKAQIEALRRYLDHPFQPSLVLLPIVTLACLGLGKTTVLPSRKFRIRKKNSHPLLADDLSNHQIEALIGSPSVLLSLAGMVKEQDHSQLKQLITGGGPLFPDEAARIIKAFPRAKKWVVFGSTEAEPVSHISMEELAQSNATLKDQKGLAVGYPVPEIKLAILPFSQKAWLPMEETEWERIKLGEGVAGEIVVTGAHVLKEYINNPQAVLDNKIKVGGEVWHRTGDAGRLDGDGRLYFLGRSGERLEWKEKMIFPLLVQWKLREASGKETALILAADTPLLVVEGPEEGMDLIKRELDQWDLSGIPIRFIPKIPRDARHQTKVDYTALVKLIGVQSP